MMIYAIYNFIPNNQLESLLIREMLCVFNFKIILDVVINQLNEKQQKFIICFTKNVW